MAESQYYGSLKLEVGKVMRIKHTDPNAPLVKEARFEFEPNKTYYLNLVTDDEVGTPPKERTVYVEFPAVCRMPLKVFMTHVSMHQLRHDDKDVTVMVNGVEVSLLEAANAG